MTFEIVHIDQTDSTNSYLRRLAVEKNSLPNNQTTGFVAWTDYQTAGRGCGTNKWESEPGQNLLFSVLFYPVNVPPEKQFILSMVNALAIKAALDEYIDDVKIKWPNDIYWHDRKICGTLIETTMRSNSIGSCIIGTGINVNQQQFVSDAPNPVSLRQILRREVNREEVLQKVLHHFSAYTQLVAQGVWEPIRSLYRNGLYRLGECHYYLIGHDRHYCRLDGVTDDGHLLLQQLSPQGEVQETFSLAFKEVQFIIE